MGPNCSKEGRIEYEGHPEIFAKLILPDISGQLWHFPNLDQCLTTLYAKFGVIWTKIVGNTHSERALTETWSFDQISLQRIGFLLEMAEKTTFLHKQQKQNLSHKLLEVWQEPPNYPSTLILSRKLGFLHHKVLTFSRHFLNWRKQQLPIEDKSYQFSNIHLHFSDFDHFISVTIGTLLYNIC